MSVVRIAAIAGLVVVIESLGCAGAHAGSSPLRGGQTTGPVTVQARAVACIGMTVADVERSARFFTQVLGFRERGDEVLDGEEHARLEGVPGARTRRVRLDLGRECVEVSQPLGGVRRLMPA